MELRDYRLNQKVEVKRPEGWKPGVVTLEYSDQLPFVVVKRNDGDNSIIAYKDDIRLQQSGDEQQEVGAAAEDAESEETSPNAVTISGPNGLQWSGKVLAAKDGQITVALDHLDNQTAVVPAEMCSRAEQ